MKKGLLDGFHFNKDSRFIDPIMIVIFLGCIAGILVLMNITEQVSIYLFHHSWAFPLEFNPDERYNTLSYFTAILFAFSSLLLGMNGIIEKQRQKPFALFWILLAVIFLGTAIDETLKLHEKWILFNQKVAIDGISRFEWLVAIIFMVTAFVFLKYLLHLSQEQVKWFMLSAFLFFSGSVVMDYINDWYYNLSGEPSFVYGILTSLEAGLEMFGCILFIYALLNYLDRASIPSAVQEKD